MSTFTLDDLEQRVAERAKAARRRLLHRASCSTRASTHCAKKLGEEAVETVIAAVAERQAAG